MGNRDVLRNIFVVTLAAALLFCVQDSHAQRKLRCSKVAVPMCRNGQSKTATNSCMRDQLVSDGWTQGKCSKKPSPPSSGGGSSNKPACTSPSFMVNYGGSSGSKCEPNGANCKANTQSCTRSSPKRCSCTGSSNATGKPPSGKPGSGSANQGGGGSQNPGPGVGGGGSTGPADPVQPPSDKGGAGGGGSDQGRACTNVFNTMCCDGKDTSSSNSCARDDLLQRGCTIGACAAGASGPHGNGGLNRVAPQSPSDLQPVVGGSRGPGGQNTAHENDDDAPTGNSGGCKNACGDGNCQGLSIAQCTTCPCAEDEMSCPQDCATNDFGGSTAHMSGGPGAGEDSKSGERKGTDSKAPSCGNKKCEDTTCLALGCPPPETMQNCPQDCDPAFIGNENSIDDPNADEEPQGAAPGAQGGAGQQQTQKGCKPWCDDNGKCETLEATCQSLNCKCQQESPQCSDCGGDGVSQGDSKVRQEGPSGNPLSNSDSDSQPGSEEDSPDSESSGGEPAKSDGGNSTDGGAGTGNDNPDEDTKGGSEGEDGGSNGGTTNGNPSGGSGGSKGNGGSSAGSNGACTDVYSYLCCQGKESTASNSCALEVALAKGCTTRTKDQSCSTSSGSSGSGGSGNGQAGGGSSSGGNAQGCFNPKTLVRYSNGSFECEASNTNCDLNTIACTNSIPGSCSCQAKSGSTAGIGSDPSSGGQGNNSYSGNGSGTSGSGSNGGSSSSGGSGSGLQGGSSSSGVSGNSNGGSSGSGSNLNGSGSGATNGNEGGASGGSSNGSGNSVQPDQSRSALSPADAEIVSTFKEVLGRNPDPIEFEAASALKRSAKDLGTALRESPEYNAEEPVDSVIKGYVSQTNHCPSVKDVESIAQAAEGLPPEEIRNVLHRQVAPPIVDNGAQAAPPQACPQSAKAVELATVLAGNLLTQISTITTAPQLANAECEGKKSSLVSAIDAQRALIAGTEGRVKLAQKEYDSAIAGPLNGFISGVSGVTEAAFKNLQAEMDLLVAQRNKRTEFENTLKAWSCEQPSGWKPLIQTEANKKADAAFREQLDSATYELASTEAALKNSQQALVAGASVATVVMSGGLTAPMLLVYGASSGTAIGVVTATTEGATNVALGNKTVDRAARDAAWDSLGYTYTAGVTSSSLLAGGAAINGAQQLITSTGASGVRLVLYNLGAGAAAGGAAGVVGQLNKAPAIFSGEMTPAEALKSAGMDTLFSLLGGASGAATTSVLKEALADAALTLTQLYVEGHTSAGELAANLPGTAINIIIGGLAGSQKVPGKKQDGTDGSLPGKQAGADPAVKDLTGKIPDSVRDQSSRPDDANQKPGDQTGDSNLPEQGVNLKRFEDRPDVSIRKPGRVMKTGEGNQIGANEGLQKSTGEKFDIPDEYDVDFDPADPKNADILKNNKYLWVIDKDGLKIVRENQEYLAAIERLQPSHTNLTGGGDAYSAGEVWFLGNGKVRLNAASRAYGQGHNTMPLTAPEYQLSVDVWAEIGYSVKVVPLGQR